jgi:hypothetical protein
MLYVVPLTSRLVRPVVRALAYVALRDPVSLTSNVVFTGIVAETTSFMAECAEGENDNFVKPSS